MKKLFLAVCTLPLMFAACNQMKELDSGLRYKIIESDEGVDAEDGDVLVLQMKYYIDEDSIIYNSTAEGGFVPFPVNDSVTGPGGSIEDIIVQLDQGDSAFMEVSARLLYSQSFKQSMPMGADPESMVKVSVHVDTVVAYDNYGAFMQQYSARKNATQLTTDKKIIENYLDENNIDAQQTESGLYYVIHEEGEGQVPEMGDTVRVHYSGKLMDGTEFDSSYDRGEPLSFPVGQGRVIRGWDEALQLLPRGSKATVYIPSPLAYGNRQMGPDIKPNSILIFDVELMSAEK